MIQVSEAAANELLRLRGKHSTVSAKLRLGISEGGCLGKTYSFAFAHTVNPSDRLVTGGCLDIIVADRDVDYLQGLTIDYSEDLMGGTFRFLNPQSTEHCSCGLSFAIGLPHAD